jgi:hypothetical protein
LASARHTTSPVFRSVNITIYAATGFLYVRPLPELAR